MAWCCDSLCTNCSLKASWKNSLGERHYLLYPRGSSNHFAKDCSVYRGLLEKKIFQHLEIICIKLSWWFLSLFVACLCLKLSDQNVHSSSCFVSIIAIKKSCFLCVLGWQNIWFINRLIFFFNYWPVAQWLGCILCICSISIHNNEVYRLILHCSRQVKSQTSQCHICPARKWRSALKVTSLSVHKVMSRRLKQMYLQ